MAKFRDYDNYEVFEDGRIWSYWTNKWLKPCTTKDGYQRVALSDNEGKKKYYFVHRVVWEAVTRTQIPDGYEINHRSEVKTENMITNLELVSHKENINWGTCIKRRNETNTNNPKRSKTVCAFKNGELVMTFPSVNEAQRQGFNKGAVWSCCRCERKTYKGFTWKYL